MKNNYNIILENIGNNRKKQTHITIINKIEKEFFMKFCLELIIDSTIKFVKKNFSLLFIFFFFITTDCSKENTKENTKKQNSNCCKSIKQKKEKINFIGSEQKIISNYIQEISKWDHSFRNYKKIHNKIGILMSKINFVNVLHYLYYNCDKLFVQKRTQENLTDIDICFRTQMQILYRLVKIDTDLAIKTLHDIYQNGKFDGESALSIRDAIIKTGKKSLPYLDKNKKSDIKLIKLIQKGAKNYF